MPQFTHLHVHTRHPIPDGAAAVKKPIARAQEFGMTALAITDHRNMFGVKEFRDVATRAEIKPILACEIYVASRTRFDKTDKQGCNGDYRRARLVRICELKRRNPP